MAQVDGVSNAEIGIDTFHSRIHEGTARHFSQVYSSVASGATVDTMILPFGAAHMTINLQGAGAAYFQFLEVSSYTDGTSRGPTQRNRFKIGASSIAFHSAASVNVIGETIKQGILGSFGLSDVDDVPEFVLPAGTNYALRFTNVSGGPANFSVGFNFYEPGNTGS